ncbi:MAG: 3',5'-cyclic-nucleotide phosphodiesterase [Myxococcota bacterium]
MELRVLGCHGGETPRHRTTSFLIDDRMTIDAGALTSTLELSDQLRLETVLVSHSHLDHIRDLATIADNRTQLDAPPLTIAASAATIGDLKRHFFNDRLWPDFSKIPSPTAPSIVYRELELEKPTLVHGYTVTAVPVNHTVETVGFIVADPRGALGFSGDTGPTDRFWEMINREPSLKALLIEVSFPNDQQDLATASGHHTPKTLAADLQKFHARQDVPTHLFHIKPPFQKAVETECARVKGLNLSVMKLDEKIDIF